MDRGSQLSKDDEDDEEEEERRTRQEEAEEEEKEEEKEEEAPDIKSNNPHLAGGEQMEVSSLSSWENHLFLWVMASMAMLVITRGYT